MTALADHRQELSEKYQCSEFKHFTDTIVEILENGANALQQRQSLHPLPDLDRLLEGIHDHLKQLQTRPTVTSGGTTSTQISPTIRGRTSVSVGLDQIAYEIKNIHGAIAQL